MKKLFLVLGMACFSLILPTSVTGQASCCVTKPTCQVVTCQQTEWSAANLFVPTSAQIEPKEVTKSTAVSYASLAPRLNFSLAFIGNQLSALLAKFMDCDPADCDPGCCMTAAIEPAKNDLSKNEVAPCAKKD